jgi:hypothetical protein
VSVYSEDDIHRIYASSRDLPPKTILEYILCFPRDCVTWPSCSGLKNKYGQEVWAGVGVAKRNIISLDLVYLYKRN